MLNWLAVIVATIVSMVLGALWYGPFFGKEWLKEMKFSKSEIEKMKKESHTQAYIIHFITVLVMVAVTAHLMNLLGIYGVFGGVFAAFLVWLGYFATTQVSSVQWGGSTWGLCMIHGTFHFVNLMLIGIVLGAF